MHLTRRWPGGLDPRTAGPFTTGLSAPAEKGVKAMRRRLTHLPPQFHSRLPHVLVGDRVAGIEGAASGNAEVGHESTGSSPDADCRGPDRRLLRRDARRLPADVERGKGPRQPEHDVRFGPVPVHRWHAPVPDRGGRRTARHREIGDPGHPFLLHRRGHGPGPSDLHPHRRPAPLLAGGRLGAERGGASFEDGRERARGNGVRAGPSPRHRDQRHVCVLRRQARRGRRDHPGAEGRRRSHHPGHPVRRLQHHAGRGRVLGLLHRALRPARRDDRPGCRLRAAAPKR